MNSTNKLLANKEGHAYKNYLLGFSLVIISFNYVDRQNLVLSLQNIKKGLGLSDTQLGFLNAVAFDTFYATIGIQITQWADRSNRITRIFMGAASWWEKVYIHGLADSFIQFYFLLANYPVHKYVFMFGGAVSFSYSITNRGNCWVSLSSDVS